MTPSSRTFGGGAWPAAAGLLTLLFLAALWLACAPDGTPAARLGSKLLLRDAPSEPDAIYYAETQYQILTVTAEPGNPDHRAFYQDKLRHSEVDLHDIADLKYPYMRVYDALVTRIAGPAPAPVRLLLLGGGGYVFPNYLARTRPGSEITVVEIDPGVTRAAIEAFGFPADAPVEIHHMDARNYVADAVRRNADTPGAIPRFDLVVCDSVSDYSVPFQLTTREFIADVKTLLKPGGLYVMNLIDAYRPGAFMNAVAQTFASIFPWRGAVSVTTDPDARNTTVFVGAEAPLDLENVLTWMRPGTAFEGLPFTDAQFADLAARNGECVLTDDWAPVENLLAPVVKAEPIGQLNAALQAGIRAAEKEDWPRAIRHFRRALEIHPGDESALEDLAHALELTGDEEGALACYAQLVQLYPKTVLPRNRAAMLLARRGHVQAALKQWSESLDIQPDQPDVLTNLGSLAYQSGDRDRARAYWQRALALAPDSPVLKNNLQLLGPAE